jgi:hypothetical protein
MTEATLMVAIGIVLLAASARGKGISYGMPPHRNKPVYPMTRPLRLVLLTFGILFVAFGLVGLLRR